MKSKLLGRGLLCAGMLWGGLAEAAPGDATRLEYARSDRAAGCPDRDALKNAVVKRLGYDPFFHAARQTIVVEITDTEAGLRAQMRLVDEQGIIRGSRELRDPGNNCGELVASLALAISIALDPTAAPGPEPAVGDVAPRSTPPKKTDAEVGIAPAAIALSEASAEATPPPVEPHPKRAPKPADKPGANSGPSPFSLHGVAFGALGAAPAPAFGFRVGGSVRSDWFYLVAELKAQLPASRSAPYGGEVQTSLLAVDLAPCAAWHSLAGCGVLELGSQHAQGSGIDNPLSERSFHAALGARLEFGPPLTNQLRLLVNVEALATLTPVTLGLLASDVWKTPPVSGAAGLGLKWQLP